MTFVETETTTRTNNSMIDETHAINWKCRIYAIEQTSAKRSYIRLDLVSDALSIVTPLLFQMLDAS